MAGATRITRRELRALHRSVWGARSFAAYRRVRRRIAARRRGGFALTALGVVMVAIGIGASAGAAPPSSPWVQRPGEGTCAQQNAPDVLLHDACGPKALDVTSSSSSTSEPASTTTTTPATTSTTLPSTTTTSIFIIPPITLTFMPATTTSSTSSTTTPGPVSTQGVAHVTIEPLVTTQLPRTGSDTTPLLIIGFATIAAGLVLQRRNPREIT